MLSFVKSSKGSAAVEAALVLPVVFLCIMTVLYMGMLFYERCRLQASVDLSAGESAAGWRRQQAEGTAEGNSPAQSISNGLYWRIFDAGKEKKLDSVTEIAALHADRRMILSRKDEKTSAVLTDFIVYKKLSIHREQAYPAPFPAFFTLLGMDDRMDYKTASSAVIEDPAEFIRNVDFVMEIEREMEEKYPQMKNAGEKARDVIRQIKDKIGSFAE